MDLETWPNDDAANTFLHEAGYVLRKNGWRLPTPAHIPTEEEWSALYYLYKVWDMGNGVFFG